MPTDEPRTPTAVASEYFERVRSRDLGMVDLFHDDAELIGLGTRRKGRAAILEFYTDIIARAGPTPRQVGAMLAADDRVAVEIRIELAGGGTAHAIDLFVVDAGRIRSLTYFIASE